VLDEKTLTASGGFADEPAAREEQVRVLLEKHRLRERYRARQLADVAPLMSAFDSWESAGRACQGALDMGYQPRDLGVLVLAGQSPDVAASGEVLPRLLRESSARLGDSEIVAGALAAGVQSTEMTLQSPNGVLRHWGMNAEDALRLAASASAGKVLLGLRPRSALDMALLQRHWQVA